MKKFAFTLLFITAVLSVSLYSQKDTILVISDATNSTEGNLNLAIKAVIDADPTGALLSQKVFKLEHYGYYILTGTITTPQGSHLTIVGPEPGNTPETSLPQILWTSSGGVTTTFTFDCYGDFTVKNVWFLCANTTGAQIGTSIVMEDDSLANLSGKGERLIMDGCVVEYQSIGNGGGAIEPSCKKFVGKITNTYFRNLTDPHYRYYGRPVSWTYNSTAWHTDTLIFENCTIANVGYGYMQEAPCYADYVSFNHCTFLNTIMYTLESSYWWNLSVTNSIFANSFLIGVEPTAGNEFQTVNGGVINIDSASSFSFSVPFTDNPTAPVLQQRHILFANNSYSHEKWYIDYLNSNPTGATNDLLKIRRMPMMSGKTYNFFHGTTNGVKNFPYMKMLNIYPPVDTTNSADPAVYDATYDPGFLLNPTNQDSLKAFLLGRWFTGKDVSWAYDPLSGIQQIWPMGENLSYTNNTLKTAGMSGFPLGDLFHWYPNQYKTWKAQKAAEDAKIYNLLYTTTGVAEQSAGSIPMEYILEQNYPNPFNPTTQIGYSVPKNGFISLKVYNTLGQEVATVFSGIQSAGNHVVDFNASSLASGVYLYQLQSENVTLTKKLVLMK